MNARLWAVVAVSLLSAACVDATTSNQGESASGHLATPTTTGEQRPPTVAGDAAALLATIPVKGRAPRTGYSRDQFGPAWADVDRNGCDTRNDILSRDLTSVSWRPGTHDCVVIAGVLADPYTSATMSFEKARAGEVQIDHVVALGDAWQTGAQGLSAAEREHLANDPLNLLAVNGSSNQSKSDSNAASWLPPNKAFRCAYVARQVAVKAAYGLWVTSAEHEAIARVLATCPGEPLGAPPTTTEAPSLSSPGVYPSCAAARAAGVTPIRVGEPGYRPDLDGDGDGVACE